MIPSNAPFSASLADGNPSTELNKLCINKWSVAALLAVSLLVSGCSGGSDASNASSPAPAAGGDVSNQDEPPTGGSPQGQPAPPPPVDTSVLPVPMPREAYATDADYARYMNTTTDGEPVFPGATGFGTDTRAGRDGIVCRVTSLRDNGDDGTLRHCVDLKEPRTIVFDVAGTIRLESPLNIIHPYVSILGHSAPGDGIMVTTESHVARSVVRVETHDVLIQFIRIRAGASDRVNCCRDALSIGSDKPGRVYNVVIDRNSLSWGTDEVVDIWYDAHNITFSYNIIAEGLHRSTNSEGPAGRGFLIGDQAHSVSVHHNFFAHNYQRNPMINSVGVVDVVNNLIYHWLSRGASVTAIEDDAEANFVGNMFISREPASGVEQPSSIQWYDISVSGSNGHEPSVYVRGNRGRWRQTDDEPEWSLMGTGYEDQYDPDRGWISYEPHDAPSVYEIPVLELEQHIATFAGAYLPRRDEADTRLLRDLETRSGHMPDCVQGCELSAGGWPEYRP